MQVFMAKDILGSIPACWDSAAKLPLDAAYREELRAAKLIVANASGDGWVIKRTELGDQFLHHLQKQEKVQTEFRTDREAIPSYADLREAVEVFKLIADCCEIYAAEWYKTMSEFLDDKKADDDSKPSEEEISLFNEISDKMKKSIFKDLKADMRKKVMGDIASDAFRNKAMKIKVRRNMASPFKEIFKRPLKGSEFFNNILDNAEGNISGFFVYHDDDEDDDT